MIELFKDKNKYVIRNGFQRTHCVIDEISKPQLKRLHKLISKELNITDWKKIMEQGRDKYLK
jgi:hypothetical protein